ncbi:MAG: hypothetical protein C4326_03795 [Ignavibacteria bacterium]
MDAAELQYRNALTIEDAVRYIPGVNITGGQVNIRGSNGYSRDSGKSDRTKNATTCDR